ncbi:uncharacterized protein ACIBXB_016910 isoform 1-T1 [Morphnus guianensis]
MVAILSQSLLPDSMWYAFKGHKFYTCFLSKFSKPPHIVKSHKSAAVALQDIFKTTFKHGRSRLHHGNLSNAWKQRSNRQQCRLPQTRLTPTYFASYLLRAALRLIG